jgi:hypothetical protein
MQQVRHPLILICINIDLLSRCGLQYRHDRASSHANSSSANIAQSSPADTLGRLSSRRQSSNLDSSNFPEWLGIGSEGAGSASSTHDFSVFPPSSDHELDDELDPTPFDADRNLPCQVEATIFHESNQSHGNKYAAFCLFKCYFSLSVISDSGRDVMEVNFSFGVWLRSTD